MVQYHLFRPVAILEISCYLRPFTSFAPWDLLAEERTSSLSSLEGWNNNKLVIDRKSFCFRFWYNTCIHRKFLSIEKAWHKQEKHHLLSEPKHDAEVQGLFPDTWFMCRLSLFHSLPVGSWEKNAELGRRLNATQLQSSLGYSALSLTYMQGCWEEKSQEEERKLCMPPCASWKRVGKNHYLLTEKIDSFFYECK